jgi:hypothetical protein
MTRRNAMAGLLKALIEAVCSGNRRPEEQHVQNLMRAAGSLIALDGMLEVEVDESSVLLNGRKVRLSSDRSGRLRRVADCFDRGGILSFQSEAADDAKAWATLCVALLDPGAQRKAPSFVEALGSIVVVDRPAEAAHITEMRRLDLKQLLGEQADDTDFQNLRQISETYARAVVYLNRLLNSLDAGSEQVPLSEAERITHALVDQWLDAPHTFLTMSLTAPPDDDYEPYHMVNTAVLSIAIAATLGFDRSSLFDVGLAGLLHRIGRIDMPSSLDSSRVLKADERKVLSLLPLCSARRLLYAEPPDLNGFSRLIAIAEINEPARKMGANGTIEPCRPQPTLTTRILTTASHYDALTSKRSFRPAMQAKQALKTMRTTLGLRFDPLLLKVLAHLQGVELTSSDGGSAG